MNRLLSVRRWGVAALASVTLFGGVMVIGEGIASAAGPILTSVVGSGGTTIAGTGTAQAEGTLTITLGGGTYTLGDEIVVCSDNAGATLVGTPTLTGTDAADTTASLITTLPANVTGCANSTAYLLTNTTAAWTSGDTIILTPSVTTANVTQGTVLKVLATTDTTAPNTFTAGSGVANTGTLATVNAAVIAQAPPTVASTPAAGSATYTNQLVTNGSTAVTFAVTSSVNGCLSVSGTGAVTTTCTLVAGTTYTISGTDTDVGGTGNWTFALTANALVQGAPISGQVSPSGSSTFTSQLTMTGATGALTYTSTPTAALTVSSTGAVSTLSALGVGTYPISGTVVDSASPANHGSWTFTLVVSNNNGSIYGQTADNTAAATYESQVTAAGGCVGGATSTNAVVLATDAVGSTDPMAAATLEGALQLQHLSGNPVGLLITSPTSLDASMLQALSAEGVTKVYVVGGPLAISPADLTTLAATPATGCASSARPTASTIQVFGPFYGTTADDTALAIDVEANSIHAFSSVAAIPSLAGVTSTTYNDTAQVGSAAGIAAANGTTAIVVADNDVQDPAAIAGVAYKYELPILVTPGQSSTLGFDAQDGISLFGIKQALLMGGQLALPTGVSTTMTGEGVTVVPVAGLDYTDTSDQIAKFETATAGGTTATDLGLGWVPTGAGAVLLSQGAWVNDALGAAATSAATESPMILTVSPVAGLSTTDVTELGKLGGLGYLSIQGFGGPLALPAATITAATAAL